MLNSQFIIPFSVFTLYVYMGRSCLKKSDRWILQGLLEGVSHSFTKNFTIIDSVKAYLSYVLLRASVSQSPTIFQVSWMLTLIFFLFSSTGSSLAQYMEMVVFLAYNICFILSCQYATGIFAVLLLRFRESLKVPTKF